MTRAKNDATEPDQTAPEQPAETAALAAAPAAEDTDALYEPYPGAGFFHGGRHSPIFTGMAYRLEQEGCTDERRPLGADWTNAHRDAFAAWQRQLRPKGAGDVSGIPDETAWDRLRVPRVTPLPKES
jgi:hypothetical protein